MASLNLDEQLFIRTLARELGITEIALETAISEALSRAGRVKVSFSDYGGGLQVRLGNESADKRPFISHKDFNNAKARLGRAA